VDVRRGTCGDEEFAGALEGEDEEVACDGLLPHEEVRRLLRSERHPQRVHPLPEPPHVPLHPVTVLVVAAAAREHPAQGDPVGQARDALGVPARGHGVAAPLGGPDLGGAREAEEVHRGGVLAHHRRLRHGPQPELHGPVPRQGGEDLAERVRCRHAPQLPREHVHLSHRHIPIIT
jgi:hypothetical protein